jgi:hypothetical protein
MLSRIGVLLAGSAALALTVVPAASAATLKPPAARSPANGAVVESVPAFTWGDVRSAAQYEFQVAADKGFGSIVDKGAFRTRNTAATLQSSLADGTYFWRVRAIAANDKAGRWSRTRSLEKSWATAPQLLEPADAFSVSWPTLPLVLRWAAVPHATEYHVIIATDPSLANPVIGTPTKPVETQGNVLALPGALAPGTYYWAVTPVDANNFKGRRSRVGSFSWGWPSRSTGRVLDLDPAAEVFDPLLQWGAIPGASKYEVEVNPTAEFTPGSKVFSGIANGTSLAPTVHLDNNTYHWRVRAIDPDGNAGAWNVGAAFKTEFDDVTPTVRDVRVRDHDTADLDNVPTTTEPFFTWSPVPGATAYELQFTEYSAIGGGYCDWSRQFGSTTANPAWAAGSGGSPAGRPGPAVWPATKSYLNPFAAGRSYCMRILAMDGPSNSNSNASEWTYVNGTGEPTNPNRPAFTYTAPTAPAGSCPPAGMPPGPYREPAQGSVEVRTPFFTWDPVPGAASYYVVVARDAEFTEVIDVHFTQRTVYAPREQYADETTSYYWTVMPAGTANGLCTQAISSSRAFNKRSVPPALIGPTDGEDVPVQPLFRWSAVESAATYRLQVAADPGFGELLDDVTTAATAYASTKAYPADTQLFWRVRANTRTGSLNWSDTRSFRRRLPVPEIAGNPGGGETIPALAWHPVEGAVSYDLHVDQADGTQRDFNMRSTRFTPTLFYGTGIWRWKVRANFPGNVHGGYSASQEYVRRINAPAAVRLSRARNLMLFTWNPDSAATKYRLQISTSDSFGSPVETVTTPLTSYAPLLTNAAYTNGGKLWWRLAVVDQGGNVGAYTTGLVALSRAMNVSVKGSLTPHRRGTLEVTVRDAKGRAVRKALVRVSGAGAHGRQRTGKKGVVRIRVRPARRGTVTVRVTQRGFKDGLARVLVGRRGAVR